MTCIVGWSEKGRVWIGADSAGIKDISLIQRADSKVFIKDDFIFRFTSSFRMGQLIHYKFNIPKYNDFHCTVETYLHTAFIDNLNDKEKECCGVRDCVQSVDCKYWNGFQCIYPPLM